MGVKRATALRNVLPTQGPAGVAGDAPYRLLGWQEVEARARAEGALLEREDQQVRLTFPAIGT